MTELKTQLFGFPICCQAQRLDSGIHVLLTGGCRTHIGAISVAEADGTVETKTFPGHKDQFVSEPWARTLAAQTKQRVCVVCGIHYDDATKTQIQEILGETDRILSQLLQQL